MTASVLSQLPHGLVRTEDVARQRLVTAEILYRMPDHQHLLQAFIWQEYDLDPQFPVLHGFLDYWQKNLEGPLYQVRVGLKTIFAAGELVACETKPGLIRVH
jgi:uncharacterized protein Usg